MGILIGPGQETDPLSCLVVISHDGSNPEGVVKHPFNEEVYGIEFRKHRKVVPICELWRLRIWGQVGRWKSVVVWLVFWLSGLVL
jgi:hypothetical protein